MNLDFRLKLLVVTHDQGHSGKMDRFGGMYRCLVGLMGPPVVPDWIWGPW